MHYASIRDAAFLDDLGDELKSQAEDVVSSAQKEGERIVTEVVDAIAPSPSVQVRRPAIARMMIAAPRRAMFKPVPLQVLSSQLQPLGPLPYRAPSLMVSAPSMDRSGFEVAPGSFSPPVVRTQAAPAAEQGGMGVSAPVLLGIAALAAFFVFKK
jgi:hypothetical protein